MVKEWAPSWWGQRLTGSSAWRLRLNDFELTLKLHGRAHQVNVENETVYRVHAGAFWTDITFHPGEAREVKADGLPNFQGAALVQALNVALTEIRAIEDVAFLQGEQRTVDHWLAHKAEREQGCIDQRRWFTHEQQDAVLAARPTVDSAAIRSILKKPEICVRLGTAAQTIERSLDAWEANHRLSWIVLNASHVEQELVASKDLLDRVESKPLTQEQSRAVVCFDNRVQLVASAGSGKTSTMVAKAAYAVHRGFVDPKRIVLLAFNKQAAEELKERMAQAFERLGMTDVSVDVSTFHALGLGLIGKASGEKPDVPDWATDTAGGVRKLTEIVDELKDHSPAFRAKWDLFRFVFARDLPAFGASEPADVWDAQGKGALVTTRGERVKSLEEAMIANFLFLNGVDYRYETPYLHRTADESHRQYRPDFYYPDVDLFHEHFALDANGLPPAHFEHYLEGVSWKRQLHAEKGTTLFETSSYGLRHSNDLDRLGRELTDRGLVLDPNPDREIPKEGRKPMESIELLGLVRTFMSHAKSNGLSAPDFRQRLDAMSQDAFKYRHQMFLDIAASVMVAWDKALANESGIDFEDMLNLAAGHLESCLVDSPYDLVMADEFQDASRARARLCRALVQAPGRYFFAVGDDWQSINRFAGADVSVMTGFQEWFGHGQVLKLEQTFRCPQALCDVSSSFVSKNPGQIAKHVHSATPAQGPVIQAFQVDSMDQLADAIDRFVMNLAEGVRSGSIPPGRNGKVSVYVLGRYNADKQYLPVNQRRFTSWVRVTFLTIHRAKGSEADYVILPEMISAGRRRSFPNTRTDDSVLSLVMPGGDSFPLGEERRLFYVALTRARRTVAMFTARGQRSTFLRELEEDGAVVLTDIDGKVMHEVACPTCKQGVLVLRTGPYGEFRSCSNFPFCAYKTNRREVKPLQVASQRTAAKNVLAAKPSLAADPVATANPTPRRSLSSMLQSLNDGLTKINRDVSRAEALQSATSDLKHKIYAERIVIETALKMARRAIELEEQLKDPDFRSAYQSISAALADQSDMAPNDLSSINTPVPTFQRAQPHPDAEFEATIQRSFDEFHEQREAFLSVVHGQLTGDAALRRNFLASLKELDGDRYRQVLDPTSSWTLN